MNWKRIVKGAGFGLALSVGSNLVGRHMIRNASPGDTNNAIRRAVQVADIGQRGGAVVAAKFGGWQGVLAYQIGDWVIDRWNQRNTNAQFGSGTFRGTIAV